MKKSMSKFEKSKTDKKNDKTVREGSKAEMAKDKKMLPFWMKKGKK